MDYVVPMITEITKAQILINNQLAQALERLTSVETRVDKVMEATAAVHKRLDAMATRKGQNRASSRCTRDDSRTKQP